MVEENKDEGVADTFKILLEEALERLRNTMMENFDQILRGMPACHASSSGCHSRGSTPFKVRLNFGIHTFEGQIDKNIVNRWLNMFEGYFSIHYFSNR